LLPIYRTYQVKPKDTLASIAKAHELDVEELKAYHNERAAVQDQIQLRLPPYLKEFILPPEGFILKNGKEIWANNDEVEPEILKEPVYGKLSFAPPENDLTYGVLKTLTTGKKETTIKYKVSLRFYPEDSDGEFFVSVDKISKTYINDQEPDLIADEMALACTDVLYPLVLQLDKNRSILQIHNHKDLLKRWDKKRNNELQYFQGEVADNYFDRFEQSLQSKEYLLHKLKNDWFFVTFFNKIYTVYDNKSNIEQEINFPILPHTKEVQYTIDQLADRYLVNNRVKIKIKGECTDPRSKTELESKIYFPAVDATEEGQVEGDFKGAYFLDPRDNHIQFGYIECGLSLNEPKGMNITISETEMKQDEEHRHAKYVMEAETEKKSFWKSIFS